MTIHETHSPSSGTAPVEEINPEQKGAVPIWFCPKRILRVLLLIIGMLVTLGVIAHILRFGFGYTSAFGFIALFDLNQEANFPTWFSVMLMMACALLLGLIAAAKKSIGDQWFPHWAVLGAIFALMSIDEFAQIHERTIKPLKQLLNPGELLTNAWVILAFILLPILALMYARFLLALPRRSRRLFILSGVVYIAGVVGVEMISGLMKSRHGLDSLKFAISATIEETIEMIGLALFFYALADYMARQQIIWRLTFRHSGDSG